MGMFKNILVRAHHGDKEAVDKLYEQYKPLLRKYSFVNGVFDEDLHHILVIALSCKIIICGASAFTICATLAPVCFWQTVSR